MNVPLPGRATAAVLLALVAGLTPARAEERVQARIIDYSDGSRGLERVETGGDAYQGRVSTLNARRSGAPVGGSTASGAAAGGSSPAPAARGGAKSAGAAPRAVPPGEGVEMIVGGSSQDGVAVTTTVPVIE